jgi:hypothetical protein
MCGIISERELQMAWQLVVEDSIPVIILFYGALYIYLRLIL